MSALPGFVFFQKNTMNRISFLLIILPLSVVALISYANIQTGNAEKYATVTSSTDHAITIEFNLSNINRQEVISDGETCEIFNVPSGGITYERDRPILPSISRFVIVPPQAGLELVVKSVKSNRFSTGYNPTLCLEGELPPRCQVSVPDSFDNNDEEYSVLTHLSPPVIAEMSEPMVIRGVRLVKITTFPIQFNSQTNIYIHHERIETTIRFTDDEPVNPVIVPTRRNRSREFLKFIKALVINGDDVGRDDPDNDFEPEHIGHYLVVTHERCLEYAIPFIEWRRKAGYKVDILSLTRNQALNENFVRNAIQDRYDAYLQQGIDPFDNLLLIGDRTEYYTEPDPQWILDAPRGQSVWHSGANHADFEYALLEGDDLYPDVAFNRWSSGSRDLMELAVAKTLMYEATPEMDDTDWFTRGGVLSQHWGNNERGAWHITIHTNVRWGEEVLKRLGYDDITFYENYNWDPEGDGCGPITRDLFNAGSNMVIGRLQNDYWRNNLRGVRANTVFPIYIAYSGHGEATLDLIFRDGSGDELKGAVAGTGGWGVTPTAPTSAVWMEMVNGFLLLDLTFGWARNRAIIDVETYFPDFRCAYGAQMYHHVKTDFDAYGDPALMDWVGVPRLVEASYPEIITPQTRMLEVYVSDPVAEVDEVGAQVTLYAPGDMPEDPDEYAVYDDIFMVTKRTNSDGVARFIFDEGVGFENDDVLFVTVTGRDIRPLFGEIEIGEPASVIELSEYILTETEGNRNGEVNPGETFRLELTAMNAGAQAVNNVTALVSSISPWIEIEENEVEFGDIRPGREAVGEGEAIIHISDTCPDGVSRPITRPELTVEFTSGNNHWRSGIKLNPEAPNFTVNRIIGGNIIEVGEQDIDIEIKNIGSINSSGLEAGLISQGFGINIMLSEARFPEVRAGRTARITGRCFNIVGNQLAVPGSSFDMLLILSDDNGFIDTAYFNLQVDVPRESAPQGPDGYGYICFDDTDDEWNIAPEYDWVEISRRSNDRDYDGTLIDFNGRSPFNIGEAEVIPMQYTVRFYGQEYDTITVSTNGFISMGNQPRITNFQNWPLDRCIGGGVGMIAPFWDHLSLSGRSDIYYYHDREEDRFIVEWYQFRHAHGADRDLTFEIIFQDEKILFQYNTISQSRGEGNNWDETIPYASVGISSPDGMTGINYTYNNEYPVTSAVLEARRAILFTTSLHERNCFLYGTVADVETEEPLEGAVVATSNHFAAITEPNGYWCIHNMQPRESFNVTVHAQGYNDSTRIDFELVEDDSLEINFELLHPEFIPSTWELEAVLYLGHQIELEFAVENRGNGPLDWEVERRLIGEANFESWTLRHSYAVGRDLDDGNVMGVVFIDNHFYISAANNRNPRIFVMNREGEVIRSFDQPVQDHYRGMRDLAYDGELIWGAIDSRIFGITTDGDVIYEWSSQFQVTSAITWDPDRELIWLCGTTTNIHAHNREGFRMEDRELNRNGLRIYGLAYWSDDPNNCPLYVLSREPGTNRQMVHKYNPDMGDTLWVSYLDPEAGGSPGGAFITDRLDIYSVVMAMVSDTPREDGGDRIDIWQIDSRKDWFSLDIETDEGRIEAESGRIESLESNDFVLTLDATDLMDTTFNSELCFTHNADSGRAHILIELEVIVPPLPMFDLYAPEDQDTLHSSNVRFIWYPVTGFNDIENISYQLRIMCGLDSTTLDTPDTTLIVNLDTLEIEMESETTVIWWVNAIMDGDTVMCNSRFTFHLKLLDMADNSETLPVEFGFTSVYPNPFNALTTISFGVTNPGRTILEVFDITGQEVALLYNGMLMTGYQQTVWNAERLPSGVYLLRLESGKQVQTTKVALVR